MGQKVRNMNVRHGTRRRALTGLCTGLLMLGLGVRQVEAATITVDDQEDELNHDGSCSLREAVESANTDTAVDGCNAGSGADIVVVPAGTYTLTLVGTDDFNQTGDLDLASDIVLQGAGRDLTIIDGGGIDRVLDARCVLGPVPLPIPPFIGFCPSVSITIAALTIRGGHPPAGGAGGGLVTTYGISDVFEITPVTLLRDSRVTGNVASDGGGAYNDAVLMIQNTIIDNNEAVSGHGGGVRAFGPTTIEDSEVASNTSALSGGGIYDTSATTVRRTLIAWNSAGDRGGGFQGVNNSSLLENVTVTGNDAVSTAGAIACGTESRSCSISLNHSTVFSNTAGTGAGGIAVTPGGSTLGLFEMSNSIVADNGGLDVSGAFVSNGHNIVQNVGSATGFPGALDQLGVGPLLAPLADNGGPTATLALATNSPAVNAGTCFDNGGNVVTEDQRGAPRPEGASCDVGAFEGSVGEIADGDGDGVADSVDNCINVPNGDQADGDGDGQGDLCDDADNDGVPDADDNCRFTANPAQADFDGDGQGDLCDDDDDDDGVPDADDNCRFTANPGQADFDGDGQGDLCDDDADGDGVLDFEDACQMTAPNDPSAGVPANGLRRKRWADLDGDGLFDTVGTSGASFSMVDTHGCSCAQLIGMCGYGSTHTKFGCHTSVMEDAVDGGPDLCASD